MSIFLESRGERESRNSGVVEVEGIKREYVSPVWGRGE